MPTNAKLTRILSIDGGGIRGILPGQILVALENKLKAKTNNPLAKLGEFFDMIAGTSTGGILTCIYLTPDLEDNNKARYSAQDAVNLYLEYGNEIFSVPFFHKIRTGSGVLDEKYPAQPLQTVLDKYFGELELKELIKPCLISSYDVYDSRAHFFTQHDARKTPGRNYLVREVARATSAAPTYFEAAKATSKSGVSYPLIDGGVFANNPAMCAYAEARQLEFDEFRYKPIASEMLFLSLGTGESTKKKLKYEKVKKYGIVEWIKPLIDIMMSGVSQTVNFQLKQIYRAVGKEDQYVRIEPILHHAKPDMDDASPENLAALKEAGTKSAEDEQNDAKLDYIADMLIANA